MWIFVPIKAVSLLQNFKQSSECFSIKKEKTFIKNSGGSIGDGSVDKGILVNSHTVNANPGMHTGEGRSIAQIVLWSAQEHSGINTHLPPCLHTCSYTNKREKRYIFGAEHLKRKKRARINLFKDLQTFVRTLGFAPNLATIFWMRPAGKTTTAWWALG